TARNLLVVEADDAHRGNLVDLIGDGDVHTSAVATGAEALASLQDHPCDCLVLDLVLPDMSGLELIHKIRKRPELRDLPIIVHTVKELTGPEQEELDRL